MRFLTWSAAALTFLLLAGCVSRPPAPVVDATTGIEEFQLTGRVAVNLDGRGYSARLKWHHGIGSDEMWIYSPIGSTIATLVANGDRATLVNSKKETFSSDNVTALTREVLGWDLPLAGLRHWALGRVDPQMPVLRLERDAQMRIRRFAQGGWQIDYPSYAQASALPSAIVLRHAELRLRLIIDRWKLPPFS